MDLSGKIKAVETSTTAANLSPQVLTLCTNIEGVELRELTRSDADPFFRLVQENKAHLTQYGDYEDLVKSSLTDIVTNFNAPPDGCLRMGIWRGQELMGRVDLNPVAPGVFVLGYRIGAAYTGSGYMTAACRALIEYVGQCQGGKEFWAGVRHANLKSAAVVEKLGFIVYESLPERKRYKYQPG